MTVTTVFAAESSRSIRDFGVLPESAPEVNARNLQKAIDWATGVGCELKVDPTDNPYPISSGIVLRKNVSLIGVHGPAPRGTRHPQKRQPVGSVFKIMDDKAAFITVESGTQIRGIQFWYAQQNLQDPVKVIKYPPTIQVSMRSNRQGVTLANLTFYGEYIA